MRHLSPALLVALGAIFLGAYALGYDRSPAVLLFAGFAWLMALRAWSAWSAWSVRHAGAA